MEKFINYVGAVVPSHVIVNHLKAARSVVLEDAIVRAGLETRIAIVFYHLSATRKVS